MTWWKIFKGCFFHFAGGFNGTRRLEKCYYMHVILCKCWMIWTSVEFVRKISVLEETRNIYDRNYVLLLHRAWTPPLLNTQQTGKEVPWSDHILKRVCIDAHRPKYSTTKLSYWLKDFRCIQHIYVAFWSEK